MKRPENDKWLNEVLSETIGSKKSRTDFEEWKQKHPEAVEMLTSRARSKASTIKRPHSIRIMIMKSPIAKLATAAVIILGVYFGFHFTGGPDLANLAWAEVTSRVAQVDYVHVLHLRSRDNILGVYYEGWYVQGKLVMRYNERYTTYDDGQTLQGFDDDKRLMVKRPSYFAEGQTFLEIFTAGLLSDKNEQFSQQTPTNVGDDFRIYKFEPSPDDSDYIEEVFITVGKNSLLPVQVKFYVKGTDYDLIMFDYEAPGKPPEFFEPPAYTKAPHGVGKVVLDGEEVVIDIHDAPGIETAVVRLHSKSSDNSGKPTFSLDVVFIIEESYRSRSNFLILLQLNEFEPRRVNADDWPQKYRYVTFLPLLKPTDREDTYIVEINCWLRTKED